MEELPDYFDVIVVGTGMPECIIAAAAARIGKKVLHLDRNGYYGGDWASFSFDKFLEWIEETKVEDVEHTVARDNSSISSFLNDDESVLLCPLKSDTITNIVVKSYISDSPPPPIPNINEDHVNENSGSSLVENVNGDQETNLAEGPETLNSDEAGTTSESAGEVSDGINGNPVVNSTTDNASQQSHDVPTSCHQEWTTSSLIENRRKFNIDLAPKLMFSRGSLVELLISSNIARYAEFQCVNRVLTYINGHIEQVPCSRADVFSTKNVTVVEKRMLMKFLTFCVKFEEEEQEYKEFEDLPFLEFLKSKKLTPNVEHYIIHAISMVDESCSTLQGLKATQKFLQSLGRYGKSPFLCTCYGSGELPQCFCRLCAVYEGLYYLKRSVEGIVLKNRCCGIVTMGQRINCEWLVMESSYAPSEVLPSDISQRLSRAVIITDSSLYPSDRKENVLLRLPPRLQIINPVTVFEFSSKTYVCPEGLYIVYMICISSNSTAEEDLKPAVELLFQYNDSGHHLHNANENQKPNVLWCTFFNQKDTSVVNLNRSVPDGLLLASSPDIELDYEHSVKEAREIFEKMYPGEEFLPRAPDPEDILVERHNNPGHGGEKIENDADLGDNAIVESESTEENQCQKTEIHNELENENIFSKPGVPDEN